MTLLPIIERELRGRARQRGTYWTRAAVALAGILISLPPLAASGLFGVSFGTGRQLLNGLVGAAFLLCCGGCLLSCDVISAERREGTLGLLFLTRVKSFDVLAGKLISVGLTSLCALVALFPVIMIAILAGGVSGWEALRKGGALLDTLLLGLAAGLCASASQRERFKAARWAVLIVLLAVILPGVPFVTATSGGPRCLGWFSPLVMMFLAEDGSYNANPQSYWWSLLCVQAVAWLLLCWAGIRLRRAVRDEHGAARVRSPEAIRRAENAIGIACWQPVKGESPPIEWLVYRHRGIGGWIWLAALAGLVCGRWVSLGQQLGGLGTSWLLAWPMGVGGALTGGALVAWIASRYFVGAARSGELELLLTTPVGARTIASDQWRVLKRLFLWPILPLQLATLLPVLAILRMAAAGPFLGGFGPNPITLLLSFANSFLGVMALCWVAFWLGLVIPRQTGVIVWTAALVEGAPWLFNFLCSLSYALVFGSNARRLAGPLDPVVWLPEAAILAFYLWLIGLAKRRLLRQLAGVEARQVATKSG